MPLTKATQNVIEGIVSTGSTGVSAGSFQVGQQYKITALGSTDWNTAAGTVGQTYVVGSLFTAANAGLGSGAAAVARTLANRFADVVNVLDFGADPTGAVDSTDEIQAAINASFALGKALELTDGVYLVSSTLNVPRPFVLTGIGTIKYTETTTSCLEIATTNQPVLVENITLIGPYDTSPSYSVNSNGIRISGTSTAISNNAIFQNLTIQGFGDNGVRIGYCDNTVVQNCVIERIGRVGIQFRSCKNAYTLRNRIYDITPGSGGVAPYLNAYGIFYTQADTDTRVCENGYVYGNHVENVNTWTGIDTHGGQRIIIKNNTVLNTYLGIVIMGAGSGSTSTLAANDCVVQDNYIYRNPTDSIYSRAGIAIIPASSGLTLTAARRNIVKDNTIINHGSNTVAIGAEGALRIDNTIDFICQGNTIINSLGIGISLRNSTDFPIYSGTVVDNSIINLVSNTIDSTLNFLSVIPNASSTSFSPTINNNNFIRSSGNGIAIDIAAKPSGSTDLFGPELGKNNIVGFDENNSLRLKYNTGALTNITINSLDFFTPEFTSEVSSAGVLISKVRGFSSATKLSTGKYRVTFTDANYTFTSINQYNVIVTPINANPRVCAVTKNALYVDIDVYSLAGSLIDCQFSIQISRNFN
jgi:hypothetical protein